jgi:hypothetical protein
MTVLERPLDGVDVYGPKDEAFADELVRSGKSFVVCYLDGSAGRSGKCATRDWLRILRSRGIRYGFVFETDGRPDGTFAQGELHAELADQDLEYLEEIGAPVAIAFDEDVLDPDDDVEYLNGWHDRKVADPEGNIGELGVYGGERICAKVLRGEWPAITWVWQTIAWSRTRPLPGAHLYQYETGSSAIGDGREPPRIAGVSVDLDRCFDDIALTKEEEMDQATFDHMANSWCQRIYGPALEAELRQRLSENSSEDVTHAIAGAVKAVGERLTQ